MSKNRFYTTVFGSLQGDWRTWMEWALSIADSMEMEYTHMGVTYQNKTAPRGATAFSNRRVNMVLKREDVDYISLNAVPPDFGQLVFDTQILVTKSIPRGIAHISFDTDFCTESRFLEIVQQLIVQTQPSYGFGGILPQYSAPYFFSVGTGTSSDSTSDTPEGRNDLLTWSRNLRGEKRHLQGYLRSVYPINVLSPAHLNRTVGSGTLQEGILAQRIPGELSFPCADVGLWQVKAEEVKEAVTLLAASGLLISAPLEERFHQVEPINYNGSTAPMQD